VGGYVRKKSQNEWGWSLRYSSRETAGKTGVSKQDYEEETGQIMDKIEPKPKTVWVKKGNKGKRTGNERTRISRRGGKVATQRKGITGLWVGRYEQQVNSSLYHQV